ncbi:dehydrogenase/reductase SDR family member 11 isoform X1 [Anabrus simplex]|uniref:dehydrogenase/reductase SDR family member 11 isoform X1 n=1 Tax=Anabrus simplex TaxID=316456 RepID=UPI0035A2B7AA
MCEINNIVEVQGSFERAIVNRIRHFTNEEFRLLVRVHTRILLRRESPNFHLLFIHKFSFFSCNVMLAELRELMDDHGSDCDIFGAPTEDWKVMLDVNVLGLSICTREAVQNMRSRGVDDGHIVHISSIAGHRVARHDSAMYCATKHAVMALTEGLRKDFVEHKSNMKVTCVSPGVVKTEFFKNLPKFKDEFSKLPGLNSEDVADAVLYAIGTPPHVQIHEIIIKPVGEQF